MSAVSPPPPPGGSSAAAAFQQRLAAQLAATYGAVAVQQPPPLPRQPGASNAALATALAAALQQQEQEQQREKQQHANHLQPPPPPAQRPTTLPPLPPRPRDQQQQPHARVPRPQQPQQPQQQQQQQQQPPQQHARPCPRQPAQRPSNGQAGSNAQWGWWRQAGQRALLGLDLVRLPLLQQHAAAAAAAQRSGAPDASSSEAILQRLCVLPQQQQQQHVASSRGDSSSSSTAARAECWRQLLSVSAAASRQQMVPSWAPPGQPQQLLWQLQQQQPHALAPSGGQRAAFGGLPPAAAAGLPPAAGGLLTPAAAQCDLRRAEQQQDRVDVAAGAAADMSAGRSGATAPAAANSGLKPPKRTWQPKMAPDEPNWDKAAFAGIQARLAEAAAKGSAKLPRSLPEHSTATFAMLMLLHSAGWPNHVLWERWQAAHPPGSLTMFVHMKSGVSLGLGMPGRELIGRCKLKACVDSRWGDISLVHAQLDSLAEILKRCPHVTHIGLASGHDIPVSLIRPGLLLPGVSLYGAYQFGPTETRTLKVAVVDQLVSDTAMTEEEAQSWGRALSFHHQWMVLAREHAAALVQHSREIMMIGRVMHKACCSVKAGMAPDEFMFVTALRQRGYIRSVQRVEVKPGMRYPPGSLLNSYPTFVVFPAESSPHPVLWTNQDDDVECQVDDHTGEQQRRKRLSLANCLDYCVARSAIFFRKVEIRQTRGEELVMLLSCLEEMWAGRRKVVEAGGGPTKSSASNNSGSGGGAASARRAGKRKKQPSVLAAAGCPAHLAPSRDASPASSAVAAVSDGGAAQEGDDGQEQKRSKLCE